MKLKSALAIALLLTTPQALADGHGHSEKLCLDAGPQTPRDISNGYGLNTVTFPGAPASSEMNLCNIHSHTQAEHRGPGFNIPSPSAEEPGFICNDTSNLTPAELAPYPGAFPGAEPGKTIEVHWVFTSCDASPGEGLGASVTLSLAGWQEAIRPIRPRADREKAGFM